MSSFRYSSRVAYNSLLGRRWRRQWKSHAVSSRWTSIVAAAAAPDNAATDLTTITRRSFASDRQTKKKGSSSSSSSSSSSGKNSAMKRQRNNSISSSDWTARGQRTGDNVTASSSSLPPPPSSSSSSPLMDVSTVEDGFRPKVDLKPDLERYYFENHDETTMNSSSLTSSSSSSSSSSSMVTSSSSITKSWESNKLDMSSLIHSPRSFGNSINATTNGESSSLDTDLLIDRGEMFDPTIHLPHAPQDWRGYEPATPLSDFLMQRIGVSGRPISTAEFMRHALTHPLYGYYTNSSTKKKNNKNHGDGSSARSAADDDIIDDFDHNEWDNDIDPTLQANNELTTIFGRAGDFVTAPELSSVFGHTLCIWFMTVWQQAPLNRPTAFDMVEFGPGRGTLMADLLELAHSSKLVEFGKSIRTVHFIEASLELRKEQKETLKRCLGHLVELEFEDGGAKDDNPTESADKKNYVNSIRVVWHDNFTAFKKSRNKDTPVMMILQEFLDALPVHQFQKTEEGWRERMIDVASVDDDADANQDDTQSLLASDNSSSLKPRLRQVLAPQVTPAVEVLLNSSKESYEAYSRFPVGTVVEVCPDALMLVQDIAKLLHESQGAALIVDYGEEGTTDTLRAFSRHQQVPLTSKPGMVDVTADVDFFALKQSVSQMTANYNQKDEVLDIHAFGPVPQGEFLMKMGAGEMATNAIENPETTEEQAQAIFDALKFLVMSEHMGTKFKVMALAKKRDGLFGPAGME